MKQISLILFIFIFYIPTYAQSLLRGEHQQFIPQLLEDLETAKDTQRVNRLNDLSWAYRNINPSQAKEYAQRAKLLSNELKYSKGLIEAFNHLGVVYTITEDYENALKSYFQGMRLAKVKENKIALARALNQIGEVYYATHDFTKALSYYEQSLKIAQKINAKTSQAVAFNNIALIYRLQKKYRTSIEKYEKAIELYKAVNDSLGWALSYSHLGEVFIQTKQQATALIYFLGALQILEGKKEWKLVPMVSNHIGQAYYHMGKHEQALKISEKSLEFAQKYNLPTETQKASFILSQIYGNREEYQKAFKFHQIYAQAKDSIFVAEQSRELSEMQSILQTEKEKTQKIITDKDKIIQKEERNLQFILIIALALFLLLVSILAILMYRGNLRKKHTNELLTAQNKEIEAKNQSFEQLLTQLKQNNIQLTDSIRYAEKIQRAILPYERQFKEAFAEHFTIFKPKDVVSGDFYWVAKVENKIFLAVVDCTGHGVPGAFMSMIGNTLLTEIVNQELIITPNEILEQLHNKVRWSLKQSDSNNSDGMDIALCTIEPLPDEQHFKVAFAGAKRNMLYYAQRELKELKGDRKSIGGWQKEHHRTFTHHELILQKGDAIYLNTDGYTDSANQERKKLGQKKLTDLLTQNAHLPLKQQAVVLLETLYAHLKNVEQRDDITLLGVKL
jgi:serine phosphatase RsbU (regulator of sigma subunit)